jgi:hypothetical protein
VSDALPLAFDPALRPLAVLLVLGFAVGIFGHLSRTPWIVAVGIAMVFLATVVLPLVLFGNPY